MTTSMQDLVLSAKEISNALKDLCSNPVLESYYSESLEKRMNTFQQSVDSFLKQITNLSFLKQDKPSGKSKGKRPWSFNLRRRASIQLKENNHLKTDGKRESVEENSEDHNAKKKDLSIDSKMAAANKQNVQEIEDQIRSSVMEIDDIVKELFEYSSSTYSDETQQIQLKLRETCMEFNSLIKNLVVICYATFSSKATERSTLKSSLRNSSYVASSDSLFSEEDFSLLEISSPVSPTNPKSKKVPLSGSLSFTPSENKSVSQGKGHTRHYSQSPPVTLSGSSLKFALPTVPSITRNEEKTKSSRLTVTSLPLTTDSSQEQLSFIVSSPSKSSGSSSCSPVHSVSNNAGNSTAHSSPSSSPNPSKRGFASFLVQKTTYPLQSSSSSSPKEKIQSDKIQQETNRTHSGSVPQSVLLGTNTKKESIGMVPPIQLESTRQSNDYKLKDIPERASLSSHIDSTSQSEEKISTQRITEMARKFWFEMDKMNVLEAGKRKSAKESKVEDNNSSLYYSHSTNDLPSNLSNKQEPVKDTESGVIKKSLARDRAMSVERLEKFMSLRPSIQSLKDKHILEQSLGSSSDTTNTTNTITATNTTIEETDKSTPHQSKKHKLHRPSLSKLGALLDLCATPLFCNVPNDWRLETGGKRRKKTLSPSSSGTSVGSVSPTSKTKMKTLSIKLQFPEQFECYFDQIFMKKQHTHFLGIHPKLGPVCASILLKEAVEEKEPGPLALPAIIRTKMSDQRTFIDIGSGKKNRSKGDLPKLDLKRELKTAFPDILGPVKLERVDSPQLSKQLVHFEKSQVITQCKFGVLFCREGQTTETEMFQNEVGSKEFEQFLDILGDKIELKGWKQYRGGLDINRDTTGTHSRFTAINSIEIMFHISTYLPFKKEDAQQVERKRHIGNDVVTILFKQSDVPIIPNFMTSQFTHVILLVAPINVNEEGEKTDEVIYYRVSVCSRREVPPFEPVLPTPAIFHRDQLRSFLLAKLLNGEIAALKAPVFSMKMERTRKQLLTDLVSTFSTDVKPKKP